MAAISVQSHGMNERFPCKRQQVWQQKKKPNLCVKVGLCLASKVLPVETKKKLVRTKW